MEPDKEERSMVAQVTLASILLLRVSAMATRPLSSSGMPHCQIQPRHSYSELCRFWCCSRQEAAFPLNILLSLAPSIFVRGDQATFEIEPFFGVKATELYPDVKYATVNEYLNRLLYNLPGMEPSHNGHPQ